MILDPVYVSQQCSTWGTLESHIHLYSHAKTNRLADNWERIKILSKRTERPVFNQYLHLWYHWMLIMSLPRADFFHVVNTRNTHFFPNTIYQVFLFWNLQSVISCDCLSLIKSDLVNRTSKDLSNQLFQYIRKLILLSCTYRHHLRTLPKATLTSS